MLTFIYYHRTLLATTLFLLLSVRHFLMADGWFVGCGLEETQNLSERRSTSLRHQPQDPHKILKNLTLQK
jgi:hypothetical protein